MRKRFFVIVLLGLTVFAFGLNVRSTYCDDKSLIELQESLSEEIDETLGEIDFDSIQSIIDNFSNNQKKMFSLGNIKDKIKDVVAGNSKIDYSSFLGALVSLIFEFIAEYLPMFAIIISVGIVSSILGNLKGKFNEKAVGDIVHFACLCVVVVVVSTIIKGLISDISSSIFNMQTQMNVIFPIILTLMTAIGANASVGVFQPTMAVFTSLSSKIFSSLVLPIFTASFCFAIVGNMSNNVKLDKFNAFFNSLFKWLVGILFTIFFALISIQGISAGSFDSVSIRTMKFTMSSYVPILGGYLSQGVDLLLTSSILIKNAVGFTGILILISLVLSPILEIIIISLLFKIASAILQPLNNDRITGFLQAVSKCILMLSTCLIVVAFMYFIMLGLCMVTANVI